MPSIGVPLSTGGGTKVNGVPVLMEAQLVTCTLDGSGNLTVTVTFAQTYGNSTVPKVWVQVRDTTGTFPKTSVTNYQMTFCQVTFQGGDFNAAVAAWVLIIGNVT
jgi:hypothetical protein